jgi:hypothetical protein
VDSLGHVTAVGTASYATTAALSAHTGSTSNPHSVTKSQVGLGNVENTALSTWAGSTSITTVGTIGTGTWQGTAIAAAYIGTHTHSSLTGSSNLDFTIASTLRMRLQTTTYDLQVDGDVVAYSTVTGCDRKLKTNIVRIADALAKVRRLHGYTYFKRGEPGAGVIAQEVAPVLPEVVRRVETLSGEHGGSYLAVDNAGLIGLLIEAVNELAVKLES